MLERKQLSAVKSCRMAKECIKLVLHGHYIQGLFCMEGLSEYRIYPKYSDTLNVRTPSFFLKRHLFYVPYISGHVPNRVFLLSVNVRTPKTCPLFLIKLLIFTT